MHSALGSGVESNEIGSLIAYDEGISHFVVVKCVVSDVTVIVWICTPSSENHVVCGDLESEALWLGLCHFFL